MSKLEESVVPLEDAVETAIDEARVHKRYFLGMLFSILDASLLGNMLAGKDFVHANVSVVRTDESLQCHPILSKRLEKYISL